MCTNQVQTTAVILHGLNNETVILLPLNVMWDVLYISVK